MAELWVATASAAGVDIGRELIEKELVNKFVPRVIQRIAVSASAEVVEKWAARVIPVISSIIGRRPHYYFIRAWGERAKKHFRAKHLEMRQRNHKPPITTSRAIAAKPFRRLPPPPAALTRS